MSYEPSQEIGDPIPNNTPHAVSVTLPTWEATVGYEEGQHWVVSRMHSGYPRFFIHSKIKQLCALLEATYGLPGTRAFVYPSYKVARRCRDYMKQHDASIDNLRILQLSTPRPTSQDESVVRRDVRFAVLFVPEDKYALAKSYWQHSGEGISSRMGEYILHELSQGGASARSTDLSDEHSDFIEERFGRNLDLSFGDEAKLILQRRIAAQLLRANPGLGLAQHDVYLYPTGMAAIFNSFQVVLGTLGLEVKQKSVCFGFPYVDTLNILKKFGPGVHFYGFGDDDSLLELEHFLASGNRILSFYCECPSNPLLKTPNLAKIRQLADQFDFPVVVDDTVGNSCNINTLQYADIVVSSLTKIFSGDSNVMGGSLVLNPSSRFYHRFKTYLNNEFEDIFYVEDAIYLERNSRDFVERSKRLNYNTMEILKILQSCSLIDKIFYPSISQSKKYYDDIKLDDGGYGSLISFTFKNPEIGKRFFNIVKLSKGPSLGTNFTIACPYAVLAHYNELDEVEKWGVDRNLIRISIGLEEIERLKFEFVHALQAAADA